MNATCRESTAACGAIHPACLAPVKPTWAGSIPAKRAGALHSADCVVGEKLEVAVVAWAALALRFPDAALVVAEERDPAPDKRRHERAIGQASRLASSVHPDHRRVAPRAQGEIKRAGQPCASTAEVDDGLTVIARDGRFPKARRRIRAAGPRWSGARAGPAR